MMLQEQLGKPQQPPAEFPRPQAPFNVSLLGNQFSQVPTMQAVTDSFLDAYPRLFSASLPAFKLALLKQEKFTPEGREQRIASSLAALDAAQPTELSLAQWKEIVEEIEDDED